MTSTQHVMPRYRVVCTDCTYSQQSDHESVTFDAANAHETVDGHWVEVHDRDRLINRNKWTDRA